MATNPLAPNRLTAALPPFLRRRVKADQRYWQGASQWPCAVLRHPSGRAWTLARCSEISRQSSPFRGFLP